MARRYVISQQVNGKVQKYLALKREDKLQQLTKEEEEEYSRLTQLLS